MEHTFDEVKTGLSVEDFWLDGGVLPGNRKAILKASLIFHLALMLLFLIWMVWDAHRPSPPSSSSFVELVEVGPQAPPAPVTKRAVEPIPPPPTPQEVKTEPTPSPQPKQEIAPPPKVQPTPVPTPSLKPAVSQPAVVPAAAVAATQQSDSLPAPTGMELPAFAKSAPMALPALSAAGVIGKAGDPRVNVYNAQIRAAVEPRWRPPAIDGVSAGVRAVVSFFIDRSGAQGGVKLDRSSGSDVLDQLALRAVTLARFPPLPAAITENPYPVQYGFVYEGG